MRSLLLALSLVAGACGPKNGPAGKAPDGTPLSKDDAVFEAVFMYELARGLAPDEVACIRTRGATNDGTALLATIQARYPTAVADRVCSGGGPMGPVTAGTGAAAARFDIGPVEWLGADHVRIVSGGAHRGGGAHETIFELKRSGGTWKVVSEKPGMMM
jgi:hypothetical protein